MLHTMMPERKAFIEKRLNRLADDSENQLRTMEFYPKDSVAYIAAKKKLRSNATAIKRWSDILDGKKGGSNGNESGQ